MKIFIPFLFASLLFLDCEREKPLDSILGTWIVVSYTDQVSNIITEKQDVESWNGMDVILKLSIDSLCGINTTNSIYGKYAIKNDSIQVIRYGGTKVGQPEWGNMFSNIVYDFETYRINGNNLIFTYNNNRNSITLAPKRNLDPCKVIK